MLQVYIPRVEIEEGQLQFRAIHRHENAWLHIIYSPEQRTVRLVAEPVVRGDRLPEYTPEPVAEYHHHEKNVHWWRFRVDGQLLVVELLQDETIADCLHAQGVALMVSLRND